MGAEGNLSSPDNESKKEDTKREDSVKWRNTDPLGNLEK